MSTPWDDAPAYMDFDEPMGYDERVAKGVDAPGKPRAGKKRDKKAPGDDDKLGKALVPVLPPPEKPLSGDEVRRGVSNRDRSAVNLKLDGASYTDIAETLDFDSPAAAKRAVERTLAATHSTEEWDTLRAMAAARAERLFARSSAMAGADYLIDQETQEKIPNAEKLAWHRQAGADLMNWVTITGAKAATKVEITPDEETFDRLVGQMVGRLGHEDILDAEVIELDAIPAAPDYDDLEERG